MVKQVDFHFNFILDTLCKKTSITLIDLVVLLELLVITVLNGERPFPSALSVPSPI